MNKRFVLDKAPRLVIFESHPENVERIVAGMRQMGKVVRVLDVTSLHQLTPHLMQKTVDVIVVGEDHKGISRPELFSLVQAQAPEVHLLIRSEDCSADAIQAWNQEGFDACLIGHQKERNFNVIMDAFTSADLYRRAHAAEAAAKTTDQRFDALMEVATEPVAYLNEGLHIKANQPYLDMFGLKDFEEIEGMSVLDLLDKSSSQLMKEKLKRIGRGNESQSEEAELTLSYEEKTVSGVFILSPAHYDGEPCIQITMRGQASEKINEAVVEDLKRRDPGTGLYHRHYMLEILKDKLGKASSAWLVQLDEHEQILNSVGAMKGDEVLKIMAERLLEADPELQVGKWTENSLIVLESKQNIQTACAHIQTLQKSMQKQALNIQGKSLPVSVSLGGVFLESENLILDQVVTFLGIQIKDAIKQGAGVLLHDPMQANRQEANLNRERIEAVRSAIHENKMVVYYQPLVCLNNDFKECYEAMVRVRQDQAEMMPAEFFRIAKQEGLTKDIDRWVVKNAIGQAAKQIHQGKPTIVSIKVSADSLSDDLFAPLVLEWLERFKLDASYIWVEMSIGSVKEQVEGALRLRKAMQRLGVKVVLSGVENVEQARRFLDELSPDWVKPAQVLMEGIGSSKEKQELFKALIQDSRGKRHVIGSFVQDPFATSYMFTAGASAMQGRFIAPPSEHMNFDFNSFV